MTQENTEVNVKKYVKPIEYASFATSGFGKSMIYTLMSTFALIFFTDAVGVDPIQAGVLILVARIFDAINDPVMGIIVDKTHTRFGKFRPYLMWSPIIIAIATIFLFLSPQYLGIANQVGKLVYCYFTYILWGVCFTVQDVPFWSLSSAISPNEEERTKFISIARICCTVGSIVPTLLTPALTDAMGLRQGYLISGIIIGIVGAAMSSLVFFGTREKLVLQSQPQSVKQIFGGFIKNKPLMLVVLSALLASTIVMAQTSGTYISKYLYDMQEVTQNGITSYYVKYVGNGEPSFITKGMFLTILSVMIGIGMLPSMFALPYLRKKFSLKQIYIGSMLFGVVVSVITYFVGYNKLGNASLYVLCVCMIFMGVPMGIFNVITYNLIADCTDYMEWKTKGQRIEGVSFAAQTLVSKASAGIATLITSIMLEAIKYVKPINDIEQVQTAEVRNGLFLMVTLIPAIGMLLSVIPMIFYSYTGKKKEKIRAELETIRAERIKAKEDEQIKA